MGLRGRQGTIGAGEASLSLAWLLASGVAAGLVPGLPDPVGGVLPPLPDRYRPQPVRSQPRLIPTADIQRLLYIPGIGKIAAFTVLLEIDDIARFGSVKGFVSYCRLVPAAKNSGGKVRQQRSKDGNRYLKLAFHHAAVRAIQYFPEIKAFYRSLARRKPKAVARAVVAKEIARAVYYVLSRQEPFNGTFKGQPLSRTKQPRWPRLANPPV